MFYSRNGPSTIIRIIEPLQCLRTMRGCAWGNLFGFYYYEVSTGEDTQMFAPTEYVDITALESRKRAACYAHASQTPDRYYALETEIARFRGIEGAHSQAEAFVRHAQSPGGLLPGEL